MTHAIQKMFESLGLMRKTTSPKLSIPHQTAHNFWQRCSNSFLTNAEYYEKCELVLNQQLLPRLGTHINALDAGCGNGRFTLSLARIAKRVDAFDLSPTLIAEAKMTAHQRGVDNIHYRVDEVINPKSILSDYELVSCMGVISTIIDEWAFHQVVDNLRNATKPGGFLLLRDSVSVLSGGQLVETEDYATRYRNKDLYQRSFENSGFQLESEIKLAEFGTSINEFFLFRAPL